MPRTKSDIDLQKVAKEKIQRGAALDSTDKGRIWPQGLPVNTARTSYVDTVTLTDLNDQTVQAQQIFTQPG